MANCTDTVLYIDLVNPHPLNMVSILDMGVLQALDSVPITPPDHICGKSDTRSLDPGIFLSADHGVGCILLLLGG
jgi:hypothetical protein